MMVRADMDSFLPPLIPPCCSPAMPLVLQPRLLPDPPLAVDFSGLTPDRLAGRPAAALAVLGVLADGRSCPLESLFHLQGSPADEVLQLVGDFSHVHSIGAKMARGMIRVEGSVGRHAAEGMTGGRLEVAGDAGDWLAAEMEGGEVEVAGRAGHNVAAALPGSPQGMRGGVVTVAGAVGDLAGARMRRGLLAIGGGCGEAAALELRAGTVVVAGTLQRGAGLGMRRGTLLAIDGPLPIPVTFAPGALWQPSFLPLLAVRLARSGFRPGGRAPQHLFSGLWQHWHGDALAGGRGEILHRPSQAARAAGPKNR